MSQNENTNVDALLQEVVSRAMRDPQFRAVALADANAAIRQVCGGTGSEGSEPFKFVEHGTRVIVLPQLLEDEELLTEDQLEQVAGGVTAADCGANTCVATCGRPNSIPTSS